MKVKGNEMADARCSCGFTEAGGESMTDHLLEVFTPHDDTGTDGLVHLETGPPLTCQCGLAAATPAELDRHFLAAFTPAGATGRDGGKHEPAALDDLDEIAGRGSDPPGVPVTH